MALLGKYYEDFRSLYRQMQELSRQRRGADDEFDSGFLEEETNLPADHR